MLIRMKVLPSNKVVRIHKQANSGKVGLQQWNRLSTRRMSSVYDSEIDSGYVKSVVCLIVAIFALL